MRVVCAVLQPALDVEGGCGDVPAREDAGRHLTGLRLRGCLETASKRATQPQRVRGSSCCHHSGAGRRAARERFHCRDAVN